MRGASGPVTAACTGALQRTLLRRPKPQTTAPGAAEPPTSARRRLLPFYNLAADERPRVLPARLSQDALRRLSCRDAAAPAGGGGGRLPGRGQDETGREGGGPPASRPVRAGCKWVPGAPRRDSERSSLAL